MATPTAEVALNIVDVHPDNHDLFESFLSITEEHYTESWPEEVCQNKWREHYSRTVTERMKTDVRRWLWLVEFEGKVVGLANFYLTGPQDQRIGTIQELYIRPAYRGRRIGYALFAKVKEELVKSDAKRIKASVAVDELGSMKFFENYGFRLERVNLVLNTDPEGEL
ncbi:MAG: GNAT family N-acetyltransferase [Planctomycetes bacterium]|nr:GNAT family N-acetyltransferase [Planctomycetota bacterium]